MLTRKCALATLAMLVLGVPLAGQADDHGKGEVWLPSLVTETPQEGFELAIKLSRMGVKSTQSDKEVLVREREEYAQEADALMHASQVIAVHFQTVAAANDYWK